MRGRRSQVALVLVRTSSASVARRDGGVSPGASPVLVHRVVAGVSRGGGAHWGRGGRRRAAAGRGILLFPGRGNYTGSRRN